MNIKKKKCLICNQIFQPKGCNQKWCNKCNYVKSNCKYCKKLIITKRNKFNYGRGIFCSSKCDALYKYKIGVFTAGCNFKRDKNFRDKMSKSQKKRFEYTKKIDYIILQALKKYIKEKPIKIKNIIPKETKKITPSLRYKILIRDNFTCQYCGRKAPNVILHIDHIIPKSKGGNYQLNNLITACQNCNLGKSNIYIPNLHL